MRIAGLVASGRREGKLGDRIVPLQIRRRINDHILIDNGGGHLTPSRCGGGVRFLALLLLLRIIILLHDICMLICRV